MMPSPFPGMDPYLEALSVWPGFHHKLAWRSEHGIEQASCPLPTMPDLEMREEMGIIEEDGAKQRIVPDVTIVRYPRPPRQSDGGATAVLTETRREISESIEIEARNDPIRHHFVEIRDSSRGHKLITLIEILSPTNKRAGPDREAYESKQREVLESDASLIELDLLRGGRRILPATEIEDKVGSLKPPPSYLVLVNRAWRRARGVPAYQIVAVDLREWLPCIEVPLKRGEKEVLLDLQIVFNRAYDTGPYRRGAVNYGVPPPPPALGDENAVWAAERTRPWRDATPHGVSTATPRRPRRWIPRSAIISPGPGQRLGIVDDQVMPVVGRDQQQRVVPVAVLLDPADDGADGVLAAVDGADGVIEVVGVQGEVNVAGLDEQGEGLLRAGGPGRSGRPRSSGRGSAARSGRPGCTTSAASGLPSLPMLGAGSYRPSAVRNGRWSSPARPKKPNSRADRRAASIGRLLERLAAV